MSYLVFMNLLVTSQSNQLADFSYQQKYHPTHY